MNKKKIINFIIVIVTIFTMLFVDFLPLISWAEEVIENITNNEKIIFSVKWGNDENTEKTVNAEEWYNLNFNLQLKGVQTGFNNLRIEVEDKTFPRMECDAAIGNKSNTLVNTNKLNGNVIPFKDVTQSGVDTSGIIRVSFPKAKDYLDYNKEFNIILTCDYTDSTSGEKQYVYMKKTFSAVVKTPEYVDVFKSGIRVESGSSITKIVEPEYRYGEWKAGSINIDSTYFISGHNVAYGEYKIKISRTAEDIDNSLINNEENMQVYAVNVPDFINQEIVRNEDGSTDIILSVGTDKEEYAENELFNFNEECTIKVVYNVIEPITRDYSPSSLVQCIYEGSAKGYTLKRGSYGLNLVPASDEYNNTKDYTIGLGYFLGDYLANTYIYTNNIEKTSWIEYIENSEIDLNWRTNTLYWDKRDLSNKEKLKVNSYNDSESAIIKYLGDDGTTKTLNLTSDDLKLKKISVYGLSSEVKFVEFFKKNETEAFFKATVDNLDFEVPENEDILDYYAIFDYMYGVYSNSYPGWDATYTLNIDSLKEKLSDTEIENIIEITRYQYGTFNGDCSGNTKATCYITVPSVPISYSYYEIELEGFDTNISKYGIYDNSRIILTMDRNKYNITEKANLKNKNPKFYINLPTIFDYDDITVKISGGNNVLTLESPNGENEDAYYYDDETGYLVINCSGEWINSDGKLQVIVNLKKKLNSYLVNSNENINSYMLTDNENYILQSTKNYNSLEKYGVVPEYVASQKAKFTIGLENNIQIRNGIKLGDNYVYPDADDDGIIGGKEKPVKAQNGENVNYVTSVESNGAILTDISVICKMPYSNNTSIYGDTYSLDSSITLTNLKNINLKQKSSNSEVEISDSEYKIYYSLEDNVNFDSEFLEYIEGDTEIASAKNIKVVMNENYTLPNRNSLLIYFDLEMPNAEGKAGQISAVKYKRLGGDNSTILEPGPIYVTKGNPNGTLTLQKLFEGYTAGNAPSDVSLENIEFKFQNLKTKEILVIDGVTTEEGIVKTDATGKVVVTNIPQGRYKIIEESEIAGFGKINYSTFEIVNGEEVSKTVTNPRLYGYLTVKKEWDVPGGAQQSSVGICISRSSGDSISFTSNGVTDADTGEVTFRVPYGRYSIYESNVLTGWKLRNNYSNVTVDSEEGARGVITNYLPECNLKITKNVPKTEGSNDTVDGISFKVSGKADAISYKDASGNNVYLDYDKTIVVGEDQEGITQTISDDRKSVDIVISNIYSGDYIIREIDAPKMLVDDEETEKYIALVKSISLTAEITNNIVLENVWRRGNVSIQKTAEEGVELDKFKFRVYGTSYYGTNVDTTISIDKNGKGSANLLLGEYTVEEVGTDAFFAKYEVTTKGITRRADDDISIKVDGVNPVSINVENTLADGYVKIEKILEDREDDPSSAQGIQFEVNGIAPTGENIHEVITIGEDGTGVSNAIPAGGEYELSEIASTLPSNYLPMEPRDIKIKKTHTIDNPLKLTIENKRGKGNLDISTETIPEGGSVFPIEYKIQEVITNDQAGEYTRISGTEKTVDGDILGRASLIDLPSGSYIVEQLSVPTGWKKDMAQIVDVPINNTENVVFVMEQSEQFSNSKVTISKTILNAQGEVATEQDYEKYQLIGSTSFEAKITNSLNGKTYYTFISPDKPGIIEGLPQGNYEIEEVYKPKYKVQNYMILDENNNFVEIEPASEKYTFEIGSEEDGKNEVTLHINNMINVDSGMCGQAHRDNLSKLDIENEPEEKIYTRVAVIVVDEEGKKIDNCTFEIYNSDGYNIYEFTPRTKEVILKGLEPDTYMIKNIKVPDGYLLADDTYITVYSDAVRTKRIEIQKNIPRGNITIQTVYEDDKGREKYVPSSKYQIVNNETGELMTFVKQSDGSYKRSNLPTAIDEISIRAGKAIVKGIETNTYDVGIIDIDNHYGIIKTDDVEIIDIVENESRDVKIQAKKRYIEDIQSCYDNTLMLDNFGKVWSMGANYVGTGNSNSIYEPICIFENAKKISIGYYGRAIIDNDGNLYTWGGLSNGNLGTGDNTFYSPTRIGFTNTKFIDVSVGYESTMALDTDGKIWYSGYKYASGIGQDMMNNIMPSDSYFKYFICLSDISNTPFYNIKAKKVYCGYTMNAIIDDEGKLWTFSGSNYNLGYIPTSSSDCYWAKCVSLTPNNDIYEAYKNGIRIVDVHQNCALDENGTAYLFGTYKNLSMQALKATTFGYDFNNKKIKKIVGNAYSNYSSSGRSNFAFITEDNELYIDRVCVNDLEKYRNYEFTKASLGEYNTIFLDSNSNLYSNLKYKYDYYSGGYNIQSVTPQTNELYVIEFQTTLPNYNSHFKYDMKFKKVRANSNGTIALDDDGNIWTWGSSSYYNFLGNTSYNTSNYLPRMVEFDEDVKFSDIEITTSYVMLALDTKGRVWTWGYAYGGEVGTTSASRSYNLEKTCISKLSNYDNPLAIAYEEGITIKKLKTCDYIVMALDSENKLWVWGNYSSYLADRGDYVYPVRINDFDVKDFTYSNGYLAILTRDDQLLFYNKTETKNILEFGEESELATALNANPFKIVSIENRGGSLVILDEYGRVWYKSYLGSDYCISTQEDSTLYEDYSLGKKIVFISDTLSGEVNVIDDSGVLITDIMSEKHKYTNEKYVYVTSYSDSYFAIDEDGHLWRWGSNLSGRLGTGDTLNVTEPTVISEPVYNNWYQRKFANIYNGKLATEDGKVYTTGSYFTYYDDVLFDIDACIDVDDRYFITENGDVYYEGDDKYHKILENGKEFVRSEETIKKWLLDNDNKLYILDGAEATEVIFDGDFQFKEFITDIRYYYSNNWRGAMFKDINDEYWLYINSNAYGIFGDGTDDYRGDYIGKKIGLDENHRIKELLWVDFEKILVKDEDDILWSWGNNDDGCLGPAASVYDVLTPYNTGVTVDQFEMRYLRGSMDEWTMMMLLDKEGHVWTAGADPAVYGADVLGKNGRAYSSTLGLVDNYEQMGKIIKICLSSDSAYAINEDGELWVWGGNYFGSLGYKTRLFDLYSSRYYWLDEDQPVCLNRTLGNTFYGKRIKNVIDLEVPERLNGKYFTYLETFGKANVMVIDEDDNAYLMGYENKSMDYSSTWYRNYNDSYPNPKYCFKLKELCISGDKVVAKTYENQLYFAYRNNYDKNVGGFSYWTTGHNYLSVYDLTIDDPVDEIYKRIYGEAKYVDPEQRYVVLGGTKYEFPEDVTASKICINDNGLYMIDTEGNLWIRGYSGIGKYVNDLENLTQREVISDAIFNKIRHRWNLITRKY